MLNRVSKKGCETESPWEGAYRQKHLKVLLSNWNSMLVALPGDKWLIVGGVWHRDLCIRMMRPSLGEKSL